MLAILDLDPVFLPASAIWPTAMLGSKETGRQTKAACFHFSDNPSLPSLLYSN
jgi:hypothetical protein